MNIMRNKKITAIVAHPDDEALGLGGTLIKHVQMGDEVNIIILSSGEAAKPQKDKTLERVKNAKSWSNFIGSKLFKIYDYPDQKFDTVPILNIIQDLENSFFILKPDIVYTHHPGDINKDHELAGQSVLTALRPMGKYGANVEIRAFETPSSTEQAPYIDKYIFKPNFFVDINPFWSKKIESLSYYKNEIGIFPHPRSYDSIEALAIKRGSESGFSKAEAFFVLRSFWN